MMLCFELLIPGNNSWNGKWSEEKDYYAIVESFGKSKKGNEQAEKVLNKKYFHYDFGDGWNAYINVRQVTSNETAKIRRKSNGFCGYDWMVKSIKNNGKIVIEGD